MQYFEIELQGINENREEKSYKLSDFRGNNLIVYFYPQDDTPVCTQEAQDFRDSFEKLNKYSKIVGVSANDIKSHREFMIKNKLNFILLSDVENKLKNAFKKQIEKLQNIQRSTFILDKESKIVKYWEKVDVNDQMEEIIRFFENNEFV